MRKARGSQHLAGRHSFVLLFIAEGRGKISLAFSWLRAAAIIEGQALRNMSASLAMLATMNTLSRISNANLCAASHSGGRIACQLLPSDGWRVAVVSVTETKKAVLGTRLRNALPLIGLSVAVIVNAAWIGFLGYFVFRLV